MLAALPAVRPFAEEVFGKIRRPLGMRTEIETFVEVVFKKKNEGKKSAQME